MTPLSVSRRLVKFDATKLLISRKVFKCNYFYNFSTNAAFKNDAVISENVAHQQVSTIYPLETKPELKRVPSLPIFGSMFPWYSKVPFRDMKNDFEWLLTMRERFGDFYSYGMPGLGEGSHGTVYYVSDPREYIKVIRQEGSYPFGVIELVWCHIRYHKDRSTELSGFFGRGKEWKSIRSFLQTDLLSPQSASQYIPGIIHAAELASKGAPNSTIDLNAYLNRCTFDMFCCVMFGEYMQCADPTTPTDSTNLMFVQNAVKYLERTTKLMMTPSEILLGKLNIKSKLYKEFEEAGNQVNYIAQDKIRKFMDKYERGELNDLEKNCYLAKAIERHANQKLEIDGGAYQITHGMLTEICSSLLTASVDTTSGILSWALLQAAFNPEQQEKLASELQASISSIQPGRLTSDVVSKRSNLPYLNAFLRECHRLTPSIPTSIIKQISSEIEIHGVTIPANAMVLFNNYAIQMDPAYVKDPEVFRPERWFPEAAEARKGTPEEVIDHPFFKDPFSQGARKCPGSRVATNEIICLFAQLILDYKIRAPANYTSYKDVPYEQLAVMTPKIPSLEFISR